MKRIESKARSLKRLSAFVLLSLSFLITSCVTETVGGFNTEASEGQAIEGYLQLARGYLTQNELVSAKRHLNNVMALDPNNSAAYGIWGLIYSVEGDVDLAGESFRRSLRLDSKDSQVRNNYAAFLFANAEYEDAYEQLAEVVSDTQYPARAQAFENMGQAALQLNDLDDAEIAFERALQLNPNQLQSSLELVELSLLKGDLSKARSYYTSASTLMEFYNIAGTEQSIELGKRIENAINNIRNVDE